VAAPPIWTTVPADDGSFGWEVYHPAPAKPATRPARTPPPPVTATAAPAQTVVEHHVTRHVTISAHPRRQPAHPETVVQAEPTAAVLAATATAVQPAYDSILLVTAFCMAIACFAVGATPTELVRWRRGALFLVYRRMSVTIAGGAFLLAAAVLLAAYGP
jgi:hypothetical protein